MKHLDDEQLSLLALGEPAVTPAEADHLAFCSECAGTLAALERTVHAATIDPAEVELATPGPHNWAAIHQALGLSPDQAEDPLSRQGSWGSSTTTTVAGPVPTPTSTPGTPLTPRHDQRRQRPSVAASASGAPVPTAGRLVAMAAAAGIMLGAVRCGRPTISSGKARRRFPSPTPTAPRPWPLPRRRCSLWSRTRPTVRPSWKGFPDGSRQLVVQLADGQVSGFREVWVISPDLSKLVSLGVLDGEPGVFAIPEGLDLAEYPIWIWVRATSRRQTRDRES